MQIFFYRSIQGHSDWLMAEDRDQCVCPHYSGLSVGVCWGQGADRGILCQPEAQFQINHHSNVNTAFRTPGTPLIHLFCPRIGFFWLPSQSLQ